MVPWVQESSSEAVNAYYALQLLGLALGNERLSRWGQLLMTTEIRATQKYFHMPSDTSVYDLPFRNNSVVGIMWSTQVSGALTPLVVI